jgi:hypothetical protein
MFKSLHVMMKIMTLLIILMNSYMSGNADGI